MAVHRAVVFCILNFKVADPNFLTLAVDFGVAYWPWHFQWKPCAPCGHRSLLASKRKSLKKTPDGNCENVFVNCLNTC